ncbi:uncharacterized protein LY79DRAFT_551153 [Colletotrichum navitas]|uniref:Secreted protein n=1 Tax=Colletotrichum navitas TaxID=681940 RepID=A0AAD8Q1P8_9PEZI|nr:uncharacterized protein LY79DRAFT_551153 [Colletotrichum navitas]KAK1593874.1 hypothetical protein LY79DRAFT_551153 [Colletotrichum navitas]
MGRLLVAWLIKKALGSSLFLPTTANRGMHDPVVNRMSTASQRPCINGILLVSRGGRIVNRLGERTPLISVPALARRR